MNKKGNGTNMQNLDSNKVNGCHMISICMLETYGEFIIQTFEIIDNKCFARSCFLSNGRKQTPFLSIEQSANTC